VVRKLADGYIEFAPHAYRKAMVRLLLVYFGFCLVLVAGTT
jgi:hypothetical protein